MQSWKSFKLRSATARAHPATPVVRTSSRFKWLIALRAIVCGLLAGLLVVFYRQGIGYTADLARRVYAALYQRPLLILPWLLAAVIIGLFVAWLVRLEPMASGSGIPQVEGVVLWGLKMKALPVLAVRYLGGLACSLFGLSLGREGPSIQIGAAASQLTAKAMHRGPAEQNYLLTAGAAAGLSAAFNAPLSGMVFALEEIHRSFSPIILLSAATASLAADFVSKNWFGLRPVLDFTNMPQLTMVQYALMIPLGLVSGLVGAAMNKLLLAAQTCYGKIPAWSRTLLALLIALPVGLFLPLLLGGGESLIGLGERTSAVSGAVALNLLVLLLGKMLFTATSFGSGAPGGIFMPILAVGTLTGALCGLGACALGLPTSMISAFAVCAMAGTLTASVKAPVTSILLTVEMSGTLVHMLPVALCAFTALLVSDLLRIHPIYEALLGRYMARQQEPERALLGNMTVEFPIEEGCRIVGQSVGQVSWPQGAAVVGLRRGETDLVPAADMRIRTGDYVFLLIEGERLAAVRSAMAELCQ